MKSKKLCELASQAFLVIGHSLANEWLLSIKELSCSRRRLLLFFLECEKERNGLSYVINQGGESTESINKINEQLKNGNIDKVKNKLIIIKWNLSNPDFFWKPLPLQNLTAIVDILSSRCFIKELDRTVVAAPTSLIDLIEKMEVKTSSLVKGSRNNRKREGIKVRSIPDEQLKNINFLVQ